MSVSAKRCIGLLAALLLLPACPLTRAVWGEGLPAEAEVIAATCADGVRIPLIHYRARGTERHPTPVLLLHGISANARHFDLDAEHSLARWFAERGYEAFSMSLRGTWDAQVPGGTGAPHDPEKTSFDTYASQDLPAAIAEVQRLTGAPQVDFVGHSMGGLTLYAYLVRGGTGIRRAVTLGAPARLRFGGALEPFVAAHPGVVAGVGSVPNDGLAGLYAPLGGTVEGPVELLVMSPDNISPPTWKKLVAVGTGDIAGGVLRQFQRGISEDRFLSADGTVDYLEGLANVKTPVFVVAAKADRIALVDGVKAAWLKLAGEKRFRIVGEETGAQADYGHCDLTVGERAPTELWPHLQDWFEGR